MDQSSPPMAPNTSSPVNPGEDGGRVSAPVNPAEDGERVNTYKYSSRVLLKSILSRPDGGAGLAGEKVVVGGWVKVSKEGGGSVSKEEDEGKDDCNTCIKVVQTRIPPCLRNVVKLLLGGGAVWGRLEAGLQRRVPSVVFLQVNDGSCASSLQVVVDSSICDLNQITPAGTSIFVEGTLRQPASSAKRRIELKAEKILHIGTVDAANYPLPKSRLPLDYMRSYPHLRPRKAAVASITRIRSALFYATHTFFQNHGFLHVTIPIITSVKSTDDPVPFQVTTLVSKSEEVDEHALENHRSINLQVLRDAVEEKHKKVQELKRSESDKEALATAMQDLEKTKWLTMQLEEQQKMQSTVLLNDKSHKTVNFSEDFFSCRAYLTNGGHLHLECYACALGNVYSFGPIFKANKSQIKRSLAEEWMVEVEMAFSELKDVMQGAEDCVKFLCLWIMNNCMEDMNIMSKAVDKDNISRLHFVTSSSMENVSYTEAIDILQKVTDRSFKTAIVWGVKLTEEHESYLVDELYKRPVILFDHPKEVKPFYMRVNEDGKTVASFDVIMPKVGNVACGGQKEERFEIIDTRIQELGLEREQYRWYLDIRKQGSVKHSGFNLRFDRLVMFITGVDDARDVIPFPTTPGTLTY